MKRSPLKRTSSLRTNKASGSLNKSRPLKANKPIRRVSARRAKENKTYTVVRKQYIIEHPKCEVCLHAPACDIHHRRGRWKSRLNDTEWWLAICRPCHDRNHGNPAWAYEKGLLIAR